MSELEWRTGTVLSPLVLGHHGEPYLTRRDGLVRQTFSAPAATSRTLVPHLLHIGQRPARAWLTVDENGCERMACLEIASTSGSLTLAFEPEVEYPGLVWKECFLLLNAHVEGSERYFLLNPHVKGGDTLYWVSLEDDRVDVANLMPGLLPERRDQEAAIVGAMNLDSEFLSLRLGAKSDDSSFPTVSKYMKVEDIENWCRGEGRFRAALPEAGLLVGPASVAIGPSTSGGIPQSAPQPRSVVLAGTSGTDVVETPSQEDEDRLNWEKSLADWQTGKVSRPLLSVPGGMRPSDAAIVAWEGSDNSYIRYLDLWRSGKAARLEFTHRAAYPFLWVSPKCALILPDVHDHGLWRQVLLAKFRQDGIFLTDLTGCLPHLGNEGAIDTFNVADDAIKLVASYTAQPGWQHYRCVYTISLQSVRKGSGCRTQWVTPGTKFWPEGWFVEDQPDAQPGSAGE